MSDIATIFGQRDAPLTVEEVRLVSGSREVSRGSDGAIVVQWPKLIARVTAMPSADLFRYLAGFASYAMSSLAVRDAELPDRIQRSRQAVDVAFDPALDREGRGEGLLRGLAELVGGIYLHRHAVHDAGGHVLAEPKPPSNDDAADPEDPLPDPPTPARVARRALILCAVTARGFLEREQNPVDAHRVRITDWIRAHDLESEMEAQERALLATPLGKANGMDVANATWRSEGLAVLGWSLGFNDVPAHDRDVVTHEVARKLGFLSATPAALVHPTARPSEEIDWMWRRIVGVHWRLVDFRLRPSAMNFRDFATTSWFGGFDLTDIALADDDLSIGGGPIAEADEDAVRFCNSVALERHIAINWLIGDSEIYSEVDMST